MDRVPGDVHRRDRRVPDVHFFAVAELARWGTQGEFLRENPARRCTRGPDHCFGLDGPA